jgi:hypothetical protein
MGADGKPTRIAEIKTPVLGLRKMMYFADRSLFWSDEHAHWTMDSDGNEWWWSANPDRWRAEADSGQIGGLHDNQSLREGEGFLFAHIDGWLQQDVLIDETAHSDTVVFLPVTNGVPIIVNGYVVGAGVNESGYPYKDFRWNPASIKCKRSRLRIRKIKHGKQTGVALDV